MLRKDCRIRYKIGEYPVALKPQVLGLSFLLDGRRINFVDCKMCDPQSVVNSLVISPRKSSDCRGCKTLNLC